MTRILIPVFLLVLLLPGTLPASDDLADIATHRYCTQCGMDRKAYGYSRMLLRFSDGGQMGVCSLNCAVMEISAQKGRPVSSLLVADRNSHQLLPADKGFWVMGGSKRGVMTRRAKWAFVSYEAAEKFVRDYGGNRISWDEALKAAKTDAGIGDGQ